MYIVYIESMTTILFFIGLLWAYGNCFDYFVDRSTKPPDRTVHQQVHTKQCNHHRWLSDEGYSTD